MTPGAPFAVGLGGASQIEGACSLIAFAMTWALLCRRISVSHARDDGESDLWRWLATAVGVLTLGAVGRLLLAVVAATGCVSTRAGSSVGEAVFGTCALLACLPVYQGLIRWNRYRTVVSDPGDWLNGLSAVFAIVAIADLVFLARRSSLLELPWWELQGSLFRIAAALMLVGTAASLAPLAGLQRDVRLWLVGGALTSVGVCESTSLAFGDAEAAHLLVSAGGSGAPY